MTHGMTSIQTVRNRESIKRAVVPDMEHGPSFVKINLHTGRFCRCGPKQSGARNPQVVGVESQRARRARKTVESNKGEAASMLLSVSSQKHARHETAVGVETVLCTHARIQICPGAG